MIASSIRIESENLPAWKVQTGDWISTDEDSWCATFTYDGKWSQFLDRIAGELPNLVDFRCDKGVPWYARDNGTTYDYDIGHHEVMGAKIFPQRYICFDNGTSPTHWLEARGNGKIKCHLMVIDDKERSQINKHEENLEADQKSMDVLLETLRSRK
jgi:hypothetical protein